MFPLILFFQAFESFALILPTATPRVGSLAAYLIALEGLNAAALATLGKAASAGSGSPNLNLYNGNGA